MDSFKSDSDRQMVGGYIPGRLFDLINLYRIANNQSKTQIIHDALLLWLDQNEVNVEELIKKIRLEYQAKWLRTKNDKFKPTKRTFINSASEELESYGISNKIIDKIFEDFFNEKKKDKDKG